MIDDSQISANSSEVASGRGIDIQVTQDAAIQNDAALEAIVLEESTGGNGGNIKIQGQSILVKDAALEASTEGDGHSGNVLLYADKDLTIDHGRVFSQSLFAAGNAGNI